MQYSWQLQYSSTLINLGRDNMFSLVSLNAPHFLIIFLHVVFLFLQPVLFHICKHHKGLAAPTTSERDISGVTALKICYVFGNNTVSMMVQQEVPFTLYEIAATLVSKLKHSQYIS